MFSNTTIGLSNRPNEQLLKCRLLKIPSIDTDSTKRQRPSTSRPIQYTCVVCTSELIVGQWVTGSVDNWVMGKWVNKSRWITWVIGDL